MLNHSRSFNRQYNSSNSSVAPNTHDLLSEINSPTIRIASRALQFDGIDHAFRDSNRGRNTKKSPRVKSQSLSRSMKRDPLFNVSKTEKNLSSDSELSIRHLSSPKNKAFVSKSVLESSAQPIPLARKSVPIYERSEFLSRIDKALHPKHKLGKEKHGVQFSQLGENESSRYADDPSELQSNDLEKRILLKNQIDQLKNLSEVRSNL